MLAEPLLDTAKCEHIRLVRALVVEAIIPGTIGVLELWNICLVQDKGESKTRDREDLWDQKKWTCGKWGIGV